MKSFFPPRLASSPVLRRLGRALGWGIGLLAVFGLAGFFAVPPLAKHLIEKEAAAALHREVKVERVAVNPFALTAEIGGFSINDGDREVFGFDLLNADIEFVSLIRGALLLRELRLEAPRLNVVRLAEGRYDISDLIDEWSRPSADSAPPRFALANVQVSGGRLVLDDRPSRTRHTVADLVLRLPFVSTLASDAEIFVEPHFSATVNGAPLTLAGRSKPFAGKSESEFSIDLDGVDIADYLPYLPFRLPVALAGKLDSELRLVFRQEAGAAPTLRLAGALHLRDFAVTDGASRLLAWKRLDVEVREADPLHRRVRLGKVAAVGLTAAARLGADGRLDWVALAERLGAGAPGAGKSAAGKGRDAFSWSADEISLAGASLSFRDDGHPESPVQTLAGIDARIAGLSGDSAKPIAVELGGRINGKGSISASGEASFRPFALRLDIDAKAIPLLPAQPYFGRYLNLVLDAGELSAQGTLRLGQREPGAGDGFRGQVTVGGVHALDKAGGADFLRWKSLFFGEVDVGLAPLSLSVGQVALSDFFARVIVSHEGRLNLLDILRPSPAGPAAGVSASPLPLRIGQVSLQGGAVRFTDHFVKPNYTVNLTRIAGRISGLSSAPEARADLELRGNYGKAAPVQVLARFNPFARNPYLDLKGEIRGVDLTTLSSYSGKYAGYAIDKGKLSLFVTYRLEDRRLIADNRVFLDQLTFGERVDSPEATSLPVKLAVALLKNGRGEIDVDLPISGSIDDPEFSLGGIILRVIGNLLAKAVTSPFALLGSLFSGGEELSHLDFAAGRADLGPEAQKRLEALARAMLDRPGLKLEVSGRADPDSDREGLKRVALERAIRAEKRREAGDGGGGAVTVGPEEYPRLLKQAYREADFPKPRNIIGLQKNLPVAEMEKLMLANQPVGADDLRRLAQRRAEAAQVWLSEQGGVPVERIFLLPARLETGGEGRPAAAGVDFSLR